MKPPPRKRTKRNIELREESPRRVLCNWPKEDQIKLLTALRKLSTSQFTNQRASQSITQSTRPTNQCASQSTNQPASPSPHPDLDPEQLHKELGTRSPEEISAVLETLKKKVIGFAQNKLRTERRSEKKDQKPIEMWTQVASTVTGGAEEALSAAFSQMFLITSTEPCTVRNGAPASSLCPVNTGNSPLSNTSVPPPSPALGPQFQASTVNKILLSPQHLPGNSPHHLTATGTSSPSSANRGLPSPSADEEVSFERIYLYFSVLHKPNEPCKLTPMESAIVLDLLMSLPEELLLLDYNILAKHFTQMYQFFSYPANSKLARDFLKDLQEQQLLGEPQPKEKSIFRSHISQMNSTVHSPLNPFLIPVSLLKRKPSTEANQS